VTHGLPAAVARVLLVIEAALIVIGLAALGWYAVVRASTARDQATWARELEIRGPSVARTASTAPRALIGRLELPRVGVSGIAREGVDARTLRSAIGHVPKTALPGSPGNAAFAAHRDTFFRGLKNVRPGDRVVVTADSRTYEYVVRETRVVAPADLSVLEPTPDPTLTLITCYPFDYIGAAPQRFVVRARAAY
jgi:sortase A